MPVAPLSIPTEQVHAYAQYGRKNSRGRRQVPHALALKDHTGTNTPLHSRRRSSAQLASFQPSSQPSQPSYSPQTYSFLPLPGEGWTISPTSSLSASPPAPVSLFASPALSPAYSRRPSAARRRPSRADGDVARPSIDSGRLHFPLPPSSPPRPMSAPKSQSRRTSLPAAAFQPPLGPVEPPPTAYQRFFEPVAISRASLAQVAQPPLPVRSTTMDSVNENKMYDDLKTFVFGAASTTHDADMDDAASDAASAYNPLSPPIRPDGVFASVPARRTSTAGLKNARRSSRAGLREAASSSAPGKRRNSRAWIPSDPSVAKPEIAVTSVPRDQDTQDAIDEDDHDALARMMERAKMRAIDDGARRPSLPINIPDSGRRGSRDTDRVRVAPAGSPMDWAKPLPDAPRRPSGTLATAGFDLDFILAAPASYPPANPSGQGITQAAGTAMSWDSYQQGRRESTQFGIPPSFAPPAASSGSHEAQAIDVEDTFLSMVRQLDTEYVRRRNKWSFRQEPRRAYDYDLDPDEEVWGCEPVGTFWVGRDRGVPHGTEGSVPVVIKPLLPQLSPKIQAPPPERRSDIRIHRDEKRPLFKLSLLPAGSQSTVPVKILLATKAMHLKVASAPLRPEGRRRGHTINGEAAFEMVTLSSNSDHSGLGRIDELTYPKTSHAVAFDMLTDAELDHAGRRHVSFGERLRRAFGSESPPPPMVTPPPSFSPPWLMMAPQSAKEEQLKQIRELHTAFRAVGLLTPPKPNSKDASQANAIKAVRVPHDTHASDKSATEILEDIPADALCMILPFWQFRASAPQAEGFEVYPLASVGRPTNEREYLLVYFVPLGAQNPGPVGTNSRLSKKRSRGNMGHRTTSTNSVSMSSAAAAASWAKGRRTAFHVVARILTASELCASGLRHPGTFVQPDMSSPSHRPRSESGSRAFPTVIAMCNGTGTSVEFVPEGLDRLGLCLPSFEWQSEAERFPGLTPIGIEVVEMVWAGCVAVLGIGC